MSISLKKSQLFGSAMIAATMLLAACNSQPQVVEKIVEKPVEKIVEKVVEKPVEVIKEVEKKVEVIKEVEKKVEVVVTATPVVIENAIKEYKEAPMLAQMVKDGKIPPLAQRIPKDPMIVGPGVVVSAKDLPDWKPGKYGGTLRSAHSSANWSPDFFVMNNEGLLQAPGIGTEGIVGNVLRDFKVSDDGNTITFRMREGLKWSDGTPVTTEDIRFTYEDMLKNTELFSNFPARWKTGASPDGKEPTIKILDLFTFEMSYPEPYGGLLRQFTIEAWVGYTEWLNPSHYLKQFHKKYAKPEELAKKLEAAKLKPEEWTTLFNQNRCQNWDVNQPRCIGYPSLFPWVLESSDNSQLTFTRNPYYYKVDTAGQQLPYIDKLVSAQVADVEAVNLKVLAGEIDFLRESTALVKVPLYKENEAKAGFKTVLLDMHVDSSALFLNQTFTNTEQSADWAKYSQDVKFRKALSMAINRQEIIDTIYYGYASLPLRDVGDEASKYDLDGANKLLDELGLTNKDADGLRLGSDGKPLRMRPICRPSPKSSART
jgi:peptide/nickel transport system substrate-binding protein